MRTFAILLAVLTLGCSHSRTSTPLSPKSPGEPVRVSHTLPTPNPPAPTVDPRNPKAWDIANAEEVNDCTLGGRVPSDSGLPSDGVVWRGKIVRGMIVLFLLKDDGSYDYQSPFLGYYDRIPCTKAPCTDFDRKPLSFPAPDKAHISLGDKNAEFFALGRDGRMFGGYANVDAQGNVGLKLTDSGGFDFVDQIGTHKVDFEAFCSRGTKPAASIPADDLRECGILGSGTTNLTARRGDCAKVFGNQAYRSPRGTYWYLVTRQLDKSRNGTSSIWMDSATGLIWDRKGVVDHLADVAEFGNCRQPLDEYSILDCAVTTEKVCKAGFGLPTRDRFAGAMMDGMATVFGFNQDDSFWTATIQSDTKTPLVWEGKGFHYYSKDQAKDYKESPHSVVCAGT